jgi:hypothetical protein
MKLRGDRGFCIGGGYMINEFYDNILKIYVNSRRLKLYLDQEAEG